jgi:hypothetical protein
MATHPPRFRPQRSRLLWLCIVLSVTLLITSEFAYEAVLFIEFESVHVVYALMLGLLWLPAMLDTTKASLALLGTMILLFCFAAYGTLGASLYVNHIPARVLHSEQRKYEVADTLFIAGTLFSVAGYLVLVWQYRRFRRAGGGG